MKMRTEDRSISRKRQITGNTLIVFGGLVLFLTAAMKLFIPKVASEIGSMGFIGWRLMLVVGLEVGSAALFLVPATRSIGLLLVSSYMGGAIATHLSHGQLILQPAIFLSMLWLGAWLRHPEILWSLNHFSPGANQLSRQSRQEASARHI
ncbi:MAG TPA: DoxX family protein [Alphaproteobacteria bacterium]|nr:DoxX family protein [Alphaproteobacteria bacterium]